MSPPADAKEDGTVEDGGVFGPQANNKAISGIDYHDATYQDIVNSVINLLDENDQETNFVSDATITFLGSAGFDEDGFDGPNATFPSFFPGIPGNQIPAGPFGGTEILGVDLNIDAFWSVDLHDNVTTTVSDAADVFIFDANTFAGACPSSTGNVDHCRVEVADDFINSVVEEYVDFRMDALDEDFVDGTTEDYPAWLDQDGYGGELHAFLTWESGGTYWDMNALTNSIQVGGGTQLVLDTTVEAQFQEMFVADMFNKIARQITDFNGDFNATDLLAVRGEDEPGGFGDGRDIDELFDWFGASAPEELAKFDLNGDAVVDLNDVIWLVQEIYATWFGDADLDGDVDNIDNQIVDMNWQQTVMGWLEGDFNNDGVVNASDLTYIGINWTG